MTSRSRQPEPPVNIRLHTADRQHWQPVECVYVGTERYLDVWEVVTPFDADKYVTVTAEYLPPHSAIRFTNSHGDSLQISMG